MSKAWKFTLVHAPYWFVTRLRMFTFINSMTTERVIGPMQPFHAFMQRMNRITRSSLNTCQWFGLSSLHDHLQFPRVTDRVLNDLPTSSQDIFLGRYLIFLL